jgi:excisionase family DNA binding protein
MATVQAIAAERPVRLLTRETASVPSAKLKASAVWQDALWRRWPREDVWPAKMDVYEAAAYLRVSPDTIRRAVIVARDGKAKLAHQRLGSVYRLRKADLDAFGSVPGRT